MTNQTGSMGNTPFRLAGQGGRPHALVGDVTVEGTRSLHPGLPVRSVLHDGAVSALRHQSQDWLQVGPSLRSRWGRRPRGAEPGSDARSASHGRAIGSGNRLGEAPSPYLGPEEADRLAGGARALVAPPCPQQRRCYGAKQTFTRIFREVVLPRAIQTDNVCRGLSNGHFIWSW